MVTSRSVTSMVASDTICDPLKWPNDAAIAKQVARLSCISDTGKAESTGSQMYVGDPTFKLTPAVTANDPKLSDRGVRRGTCTAGGKVAVEAVAVTHGGVRCSAWLGLGDRSGSFHCSKSGRLTP